MVKAATRIEKQYQTAQHWKGTYLTFAFLEKDYGMELEVVGWAELRPQPDKPDYIKGFINPWGCEIPVIDLRVLYAKSPTRMTATSCIVIFEDVESYRYYFGIVVDELSNVVNIAEGTENRISPLLLSAKRHLSVGPAVKN